MSTLISLQYKRAKLAHWTIKRSAMDTNWFRKVRTSLSAASNFQFPGVWFLSESFLWFPSSIKKTSKILTLAVVNNEKVMRNNENTIHNFQTVWTLASTPRRFLNVGRSNLDQSWTDIRNKSVNIHLLTVVCRWESLENSTSRTRNFSPKFRKKEVSNREKNSKF